MFNIPLNLSNYLRTVFPNEKIKIANEGLGQDEFTENTVFINLSEPLDLDKELLCLEINENIPALLTKTDYLFPSIRLYKNEEVVPESFRNEGKIIASFSINNKQTEERIPAVVEYSGNRFVFNFDLFGTIESIQQERHIVRTRPSYTYLPFNIQKIPPSWRMIGDKILKSDQDTQNETEFFPEYPFDLSAEILRGLFLYCVKQIENIEINLNIWPENKEFVFLATHDVDSGWIYNDNNLFKFLDIERRYDIKGAWYFVANLIKHDYDKIDILRCEGHEIGLHGHNHDHKFAFLPENKMRKRFEKCKWFIDKFEVSGFRSPHALTSRLLFKVMKDYVKYDSSLYDTYIPRFNATMYRQGCSSVTPYYYDSLDNGLVEIPITIPEEHDLYDPEEGVDSIVSKQMEKINNIKKRRGIATLIVHPEPQISAKKHFLTAYEELLKILIQDKSCWICRPLDIYNHWIEINK